MPCYTEQIPGYRDECEINRFRERISELEAENDAQQDNINWLVAALCLMTDKNVTRHGRGDFEQYLSAVPSEAWKKSGIRHDDLLAWKKAHDAEDTKRRALEKLTPEERRVLGL